MFGAILFAVALYYRKEIMATKLMQGKYSLGMTFWLYGIIFTLFLSASLGFYIKYKSESFMDSTWGVLSAFSAVSMAVVILAIHFVMVAISVWKSASNYQGFFLFRWWAKNFIATIPCALALMFYSPGPFIFGGVLYWLVNRVKRKYVSKI